MSAVAGETSEFRPMHASDLEAILAIENSVYSHGWTLGIFHDCMRVGYCCWVIEDSGKIIGYSVMSVAVGEAHILNVAITPKSQGDGVGRMMVEFLLKLAAERGADSAFLEVRPSNQIAITLYEDMGFNQAGVRHNYYPADHGREDAVIMAKSLPMTSL